MLDHDPDGISGTAESNAARVNAFHHAVGANVPAVPTVPPPETLQLRKTLISEEFREVCDAIEAIDRTRSRGESESMPATVDLAHELADLLYVVYGGFSDCGIDADAVFAEVHRANMQKSRGPKRADGKAMKPADWRPADVSGVVSRQRQQPLE